LFGVWGLGVRESVGREGIGREASGERTLTGRKKGGLEAMLQWSAGDTTWGLRGGGGVGVVDYREDEFFVGDLDDLEGALK